MKIFVGGTFDKLHKGHKVLLDKAIELGKLYNAKLIVTITSGLMASLKSHPVGTYRERRDGVEGYLIVWGYHIRYKIYSLNSQLLTHQLNELTLYREFMDGEKKIMVVSEETYGGAVELNNTLRELKLQPMTIVVIPMVMAEDGERISSTRVHNKEITNEGRLI